MKKIFESFSYFLNENYDNYINPNFNEALEEFKDSFENYEYLTDVEKRRVLSLFGKFYIMKKEELNK